jgi:transcriptional regulator with XRE-family HTH domain
VSNFVPDSVDVYVGQRIRTLRKLYDVSQQKLAESLDISFQQVQKYERGANRVSASTLWRIAVFFKVDFGYFVEGLGERDIQKPIDLGHFLADTDGITVAQNFLKIPSLIRRQITNLIKTLATESDNLDG